MARDSLEPGPDGSFPNLDRTAEGYLDVNSMPIGRRWQRGPDGRAALVDVTPTVHLPDGRVVKITDVVPPPPGWTPPHPGNPRNPTP
ncbi:hypothetical protein [Kocuria marina]|uniref:hypothetical protein n=1 Tax=Kocuria marina TaxID=223184 RepID=UPI000BF15171